MIEITPATPHVPAHVHVGKTPTGNTWNVYTRDGETEESLALRVKIMTDQFDRTVERHDTSVIKVTRLTQSALSYIEDHAGCAGESGELVPDYEAMTMTKSSVTASRRLLEAVRDRLDGQVEDYADVAFQSEFKDNENRAAFREKAARRSVHVCIKRLTLTIEGKRSPKKIYLSAKEISG